MYSVIRAAGRVGNTSADGGVNAARGVTISTTDRSVNATRGIVLASTHHSACGIGGVAVASTYSAIVAAGNIGGTPADDGVGTADCVVNTSPNGSKVGRHLIDEEALPSSADGGTHNAGRDVVAAVPSDKVGAGHVLLRP